MTGVAALTVFAAWLYLTLARGAFWLVSTSDNGPTPRPEAWPSLVAIVPARDEAGCVRESISSLLQQTYPGQMSVILVDDQSRDQTVAAALDASQNLSTAHRLEICRGAALPAGWTGKLWAQQQGIELAERTPQPPDYFLLTDADIVYAPGTIMSVVSRAEAEGLVLTSLMAKLRCESLAEHAFIPAFVFFFRMLYPFSWVSDPKRITAAAAGGCALVRRDALSMAGGIAAIRGALIDDCALARTLKVRGRISLELTDRVRSIRAYQKIGDIRRMVARSAYAQLGYSPVLLTATVLGMAAIFLVPVLFSLSESGLAQVFGIASWFLMAIIFQPMLRFYQRSPLWGAAFPLIALVYVAFTLDSAYQYAMGRGGSWKGRFQANASQLR
jgi:hopene-associated glycosyltransferase HpnB